MQEVLVIDTYGMAVDNALAPLKKKLAAGYKIINSLCDENLSKYVYILELDDKPVETTNEQPKFRLMYAVPDSDRSAIQHKNGTIMLFDSISSAKEFRDKNDISDVHKDAIYWLSDSYDHTTTKYKNTNLNKCYIELNE